MSSYYSLDIARFTLTLEEDVSSGATPLTDEKRDDCPGNSLFSSYTKAPGKATAVVAVLMNVGF